MDKALLKDQKIVFDFSDLASFSESELPVVKDEKYTDGAALMVNFFDLEKKLYFVKKTRDDWHEYEYLQVSVYADCASDSVYALQVQTHSDKEGKYCGREFALNASFTGHKILTFPLERGIRSFGNPENGLDKVAGFGLRPYHHRASYEDTTIYIEQAWVTNHPIPDRERKIELDMTKDYVLTGKKDQPHDAIALLKEHCPHQKHPRLVLDEDGFDKLRDMVERVPYAKAVYQALKEKAEGFMALPLPVYEYFDDMRLTRETTDRIVRLALMYQISREQKYKDRLWRELEAVCYFPDWNPGHRLDVGDYARAVAIAYDWLYPFWDESQKRIMKNALLKSGLTPFYREFSEEKGLTQGDGNHNTVISSGLGLAALAIGDEDGCGDICNEYINKTVACIPLNVLTFAPMGVCPEGPGYWAYGQNNFYLYQASLFRALGTDFGLKELSGQSTTGDYLLAVNGPKRVFSYADTHNEKEKVLSPFMMWLSELYEKPLYAHVYIDYAQKHLEKVTPFSLLLFREEMLTAKADAAPKDIFLGYVGAMRSDNEDENAWYVGFKGGSLAGHMDLDLGTFVLDALGERWVEDLGTEAYDMPGMWQMDKGAGRWTYYRKRAEGNNCMIFNPTYDMEQTAEQNPNADCNIIQQESAEDHALARVDLTSAYAGFVFPATRMRVHRIYELKENRSVFELTDMLDLEKPAEMYTFVHTAADCEIGPDKKSAILTIGEKKLRVTLTCEEEAELLCMAAESLHEAYQKTPHKDNSAFRKLAVHAKSIQTAAVTLRFEEA